ncbi:MAG: hypothetical protein ACXWWL_02165 [Candidatus Limnocylindria bacterium]
MSEDPQPDFAELLEGLTDAERAARLALLERLHADGCTIGELRAAQAMRRPPDAARRAPARPQSPPQPAGGGGRGRVSDAYADVNHRSLGLPLPRDGEPVYDDDQVENLKVLRGMLDLGVHEEDLYANSRIFGRASHRTAQRWSTCSRARCCARETRRTTSRCGAPTSPRRRSRSSTA